MPYTLASLGLPCYDSLTLPLEVFLSTPPNETIGKINREKYWLQYIPSHSSGTRTTHHDIQRSEVNVFIRRTTPDNVGRFTLHLSEYVDNLYGGNITVGQSGHVLAEFAAGLQSRVSSQNDTPEFTVTSRPGTNTLEYSYDDETLRKSLWELIRPVRKLPGYYEFTILEGWRAIFLDARLTNPIYQLPDPMYEPKEIQ